MKNLSIISIIFLLISCSGIEPQQKEDLKLMSFNIRFGSAKDGINHWDKRKNLVYDLINQESPDIYGVQEALKFQLQALQKNVPGYAKLGVARGTKSNNEFSSIFYKKEKYKALNNGTFWLSDTPEKPSTSWGNKILRICTWAHFEAKTSGKDFYVFNTHWDHLSKQSHFKSSELILSRIKSLNTEPPCFITGDFNIGEMSPAIKLIRDAGFADSFRVLHPKATPVGTFNAFQNKRHGNKIDYIFVPTNVEIVEAKIIRNQEGKPSPSDHFPITGIVRF